VDIQTIKTAQHNIRLALDCLVNTNMRESLFTKYEELAKRKVVLTNVLTDLEIKKNILMKELDRCQQRSKFSFSLLQQKKK